MSDERDRSRDRSRRDRPSRLSESSRDRSTDRGRDRGDNKSSSSRVYVSNIPYEFRWQDIKDLFREQVGDVSFVELFVDENDKPRGCGIVEFSDQNCVKKCLEVMQRYEVRGRKIVIKEDAGNMRDKHGNVIGGKRARHDDGGNRYRDNRNSRNTNMGSLTDEAKWGNTYGLSPQFLESLMIDPPLCNRVFVANLEYNVDKKKLKEVFRLAGRVINIDLPIDKEGRSRGFAVVEYDHPVEAVQAISMLHNQYLYERPMTVRIDRVNDSVKLPEGLKTVGMGLGQNGEPLKNVAHNLPNSGASQATSSILGTLPNNAFQVASALSGLNNVSLSNLNSSVLGGALGSNFLQNGLGGANDLQSLMAQSQQFANLGSGSGSTGINMIPPTTNNANSASFGSRVAQEYNPNAPVTYPTNYTSSRPSTYNLKPVENKSFSKKVLINNLPPSASFKILQEKLNEFGQVTYWEEKGTGSFLVAYTNEWEAEQAIKNLDKARIDGRFIEARAYY